ncbi:MAG TPA: hypothetical protein VKK81_00235, partial [Candidatus Binatia bacterium]|nr:hypothetical protein [Candidatus Binatia bacterium]
MSDLRAIDCWINVSVGSSRERAPDYAVRTAEGYFKRSKDFFKTFSAEELITIMDQVGVEKAIVTLPAENPSEKILAFPKAYPGRFFLSVLIDPRKGMSALWALEDLVKNHPVVMARVV